MGEFRSFINLCNLDMKSTSNSRLSAGVEKSFLTWAGGGGVGLGLVGATR